MRKRVISPEFYSDEKVGALSPVARHMFVGTWSLADDEGLLRFNSSLIKSTLFMYDKFSLEEIEKAMAEVVEKKLVYVYTSGETSQTYAYVVNFHKHQVINRPQPSKLPLPPIEIRRKNGSVTDSVNDSVNDSMSDSRLREDNIREVNLIQGAWNERMKWKVAKLTKSRIDKLRSRLKEPMFREGFNDIMTKINESDFLSGKRPSAGHPNFKADFDWVISNDTNYVKILEGKYDNPRTRERGDRIQTGVR